ncbi:MAG: phage tail protein [Actinobacteria bacterium]|nr:phage tail protein [Actinomycetota bacterium]
MTLPAIINITAPINLTLTKTINSLWYADMELEQNDYITPECYIEFDNELYIVRIPNDIIDKNKLTQQIRLEHNMTELNDFGIGPFIWATKTAAEMLALALANTDWTVGTVSGLTGTSTVESKKRITVLAAIMLIVNTFLGEVNFNSKLRTVDLKDEIGTQTKLQVRYDKNAEYIKRTRNSQNLVTRLYCYGKDNLTISSESMVPTSLQCDLNESLLPIE